MLSKCWAPCFTLNSGYLGLEKGSRLIAIYTATTHVVFIFYGIWILCGGQSDTFFSPFFEFSRKNMYVLAGLLIVYCIGYIVIGSLGLIHAIRSETRFYYLPWLYCTLVEILFFSGFGIYILYRYYHNEWSLFAAIVLWSASIYHFYLYLVVLSLYYVLKRLQEPTFVVIYP